MAWTKWTSRAWRVKSYDTTNDLRTNDFLKFDDDPTDSAKKVITIQTSGDTWAGECNYIEDRETLTGKHDGRKFTIRLIKSATLTELGCELAPLGSSASDPLTAPTKPPLDGGGTMVSWTAEEGSGSSSDDGHSSQKLHGDQDHPPCASM